MKIIARILLLATGVLLLAHYVPEGYGLLTAKKQPRPPIIFYSCVKKEFLFYRYDDHGMSMVDEEGTNHERDDFEQLLPLDNYLQLLRDGTLPKSVDGVALTPDKLKRERLSIRVRPDMMDSPAIPLYPLLEAENGRVRLEMPDDFMRLDGRVEFVLAASNSVVADKSERFTRAFAAAGFVFPAKIVAANATTLKPYDEGYFLVDATGSTFHLRQVHGEPELKRISEIVPAAAKAQWEGIKPRYIRVQEVETREIRAFLVGGDNRPYLVTGKDYKLVPLPLTSYEPEKVTLALRGDLLNRLVTATTEDSFDAVALDRNYEVLRRYHEALPTLASTTAGKVRLVVFPFTLDFEDESSDYYGFYFEHGNSLALVVNIILLLGTAGWLAARKQFNLRRIPDLLAIGIGGVFGVILFLMLPKVDA
jgi:hypothetical protein